MTFSGCSKRRCWTLPETTVFNSMGVVTVSTGRVVRVMFFNPLGPSALEHTNQYNHKCYSQQDVNDTTHSVRRNQTEEPKNQQNDRDGPQHVLITSLIDVPRRTASTLSRQ